MKKLSIFLLAASMAFPALAQEAEPAGPEVSTTLSFSFMSSYFFREVNFGNAASTAADGKDAAFPVAPAFSSFIEAEMGGLYVGLGQVFAIDKNAHTSTPKNAYTGTKETPDYYSATETNILAGITAGNLSFGFGTFIYSGIPGAANGYQAATTEVQVSYDSLFTLDGLSFMLGAESGGTYTYYQLGYSLPELVSGLGVDVIYGGNVLRGTDAANQLYGFGEDQNSYVQLQVGYGLEVGPGSLDLGVMGQFSLKEHGFDGHDGKVQAAASLGYSLPL